MLAVQFTDAAAGASTFAALDEINRLAWRALSEGVIDDAAAHAVAEAIQGRRDAIKGQQARKALSGSKPLSRPRRPVSPDKAASLARRRRWAASGTMPPAVACQFTQAEQAALAVIAREVQRRGRCELPIDAVAALAGVSRTTTQNALRLARSLGLASVTERRRRGQKSDTNRVAILSPEWRAWLRLRMDRVHFGERHEYRKNIPVVNKGHSALHRHGSSLSVLSESDPQISRVWSCRNYSPSASGM